MKRIFTYPRIEPAIVMKIVALVCASCLLTPSLWAQTAIGQLPTSSWDFGPTLVGCTSPSKNIMLNIGDAQLIMDTLSIAGPFALPMNRCANGVKPGTGCVVAVSYYASSLATDSGSLSFNDNASNTPQILALSGHGATIVPTASTNLARGGSVYYGQTAYFAGQVVSLGGCSIPDGELMTFHNDSGYVYCKGLLQAGFATCNGQIFLPHSVGGHYPIRADYPGDLHFEPSISTNPTGGLTVLRWPTTTTLSASPNPTNVGQSVTITVTVSSAGSYVPTGTVIFYVNGNPVGNASLTSGTAQISHTFPIAGNSIISAAYKGDIANAISRGSLTEVVNP